MNLTDCVVMFHKSGSEPEPQSNKHAIWLVSTVYLEAEPWQLWLTGKYAYVSGNGFARIWSYGDYGLKYDQTTEKWYVYALATPETAIITCTETAQPDPVGLTWSGNGTALHWDGTPPYCGLRVSGAGSADPNGDYPLYSVDDMGGFLWKQGYCVVSGSPGYWSMCIDGGGCWYSGEGEYPPTATWTATNGSEPMPSCSWIQ